MPGTANNKCEPGCQKCVDIDAALARLDSQRYKFQVFLHKHPHYSNFVKEVCLDGWADEINEVLHELSKSEENREKALHASSSPKKNCRNDSTKND